jgi:predicted transposase YdaD
MLDVDEISAMLENHFTRVTQEEFAANLREFCPELFEEEERLLASEQQKVIEIQRACKLEIVPKLLQRGLTAEEVAEILELDVATFTSKTVKNMTQVSAAPVVRVNQVPAAPV